MRRDETRRCRDVLGYQFYIMFHTSYEVMLDTVTCPRLNTIDYALTGPMFS